MHVLRADYETAYVLGANQKQYEEYKRELDQSRKQYQKEFGDLY